MKYFVDYTVNYLTLFAVTAKSWDVNKNESLIWAELVMPKND